MINAVVIDEKDTVAVAIEALKKGSVAEIRSHSGAVTKVALVNDIPIYHKFAITEMKKGEMQIPVLIKELYAPQILKIA